MINLTKNQIPDNVKKIHLIAVCGTGMGALACMLKDMGFHVTGSDQNVYPPMSDFLAKKGISVMEGFDEKHLDHKPDLVIVGNAVTRHNPEAVAVAEKGLYFCSMPQAVNHFLGKGKKAIVITGTHGKTTSSSLIAWILYKSGLDPSFAIGGILKNFNSNYRTGKGEYMVIEGDEYDTAFFDKGPKFLHYDPFIAVLTSVEFDHADIFKDVDHVKQEFNKFTSRISPENTLFAFGEDNNVAEMIQNVACQKLSYGRNSNAIWQLASFSGLQNMLTEIQNPALSCFEVLKHGKPFGKFKATLMGEHNLLNTLAAIAVADSLNIPQNVIAEALETFEGVKRRQDVRGKKRGITIMDDFAHHPTAVRETIRAAKMFYPKDRLIAVFEPRTNTSMRNIFQDVYPLMFDDADLICIRKPSRLDKIPVDERFSSEKLVDDLNLRRQNAYHFEDTDGIIEFLIKEARSGDLILIMSNGGFDNIHERLLERL